MASPELGPDRVESRSRPGRLNEESHSPLCPALSAWGFPAWQAKAPSLKQMPELRFLLSETFSIVSPRDRGAQNSEAEGPEKAPRTRELTQPAAWLCLVLIH